MRVPRPAIVAAIALTLPLAGCAAPASTPPSPGPTPPSAEGPTRLVGAPSDVVTGLVAPWSVVPVTDDITLISQRDDAAILQLDGDGTVTRIGSVPGVLHGGEGGLLGLAVRPLTDGFEVYAYLTTVDDNRIVRMPWAGRGPLGEPEVVLAGIARAGNHNGGRIAFGPDEMLYATTGDAAMPALAQDPASLNGKILRMTPDGDIPDDNPVAGSYVYSMGHRNPQGIAWDGDRQLWAAELGQNTWDEFNRIEPGGNYGWPIVEGTAGDPAFIDPVLQWPTVDASPSGLCFIDGTFYLAALRGERIWAIDVAADGSASATAWFVGDFGRIRDVVSGGTDTLWFLTNNTDSRGVARPGDDRLLAVRLAARPEG